MNPRTPTHTWIEINGIKLHYWDFPGTKPTLLCVHGLTSNGRYWGALAEHLPNRIIAVDVRGRGQSDKPPSGAYGLDQHARDMAALIERLGISPCCVIGHSMGATITAWMAGATPQHVSQAVIIDGGTPGEEFHSGSIRGLLTASLGRLSVRYENAQAYLQYWREKDLVLPWTDAYEQYLLADIEEFPDGSVMCRAARHAVEEDLNFAIDTPEEVFETHLRQVRCPALAVWAPCGHIQADQPLVSRGTIEKVARLIPGCKLAVIEGTHHYNMLMGEDALRQIAGEVKELLKT
jgi:lipase